MTNYILRILMLKQDTSSNTSNMKDSVGPHLQNLRREFENLKHAMEYSC